MGSLYLYYMMFWIVTTCSLIGGRLGFGKSAISVYKVEFRRSKWKSW